MKITAEKRDVQLSGGLKTVEFGLKNGPHIMSILSGLYPDAADAVFREYLTNVLDAYTALQRFSSSADFTPPVIHLPTPLSPYLEFKDFGVGMSEETIFQVYATYGESTKNNSNDEVGGLGLGSKTAFCYNNGSPWTISSRWNGEEFKYMAFVSDKGIPTLTHVGTTKTSEHNGVTINIPILKQDIIKIHAAAAKYLPYFTLDYTLLNGEKPAAPTWKYSGENWRAKIEGRGWGEALRVTVVMGNVPYRLTREQMQDALHNIPGGARNFFGGHTGAIEFVVPIGAVDITPSRDTLKSSSKTMDVLKKLYRHAYIELSAQVQKSITASPTLYDALVAAHTLSGYNNYGLALDKVYAGHNLDKNQYELKVADLAKKLGKLEVLSADVIRYDLATPEITTEEDVIRITPRQPGTNGSHSDPTTMIVIDDIAGGAKLARGLVRKYMNSTSTVTGRVLRYGHTVGSIYLLTTDATEQQVSDALGGYPVKNILRASVESGKLPKVKAEKTGNLYLWNGSRFEARVQAPKDKALYLILHKNINNMWTYSNPKNPYFDTAPTIGFYADMARLLGSSMKIYGIRETDIANVDLSNMVNLEDWVHTEVTKVDAKHGETLARLQSGVPDNCTVMETLLKKLHPKLNTKDHAELLDLWNLFEAYRKAEAQSVLVGNRDLFRAHAAYVGAGYRLKKKLPAVQVSTIASARDQVFKKYPMFKHLSIYISRYSHFEARPDFVNEALDYINCCGYLNKV